MQHALAFQLGCEPADFLHQAARRDRAVVQQRLVSDVDELEHVWYPGVSSGGESAENSGYSPRNFTKRSRDPPDSRSSISTSSATARVIAIPRPPSLRSPLPRPPRSAGSNPWPSSATSTTSRS